MQALQRGPSCASVYGRNVTRSTRWRSRDGSTHNATRAVAWHGRYHQQQHLHRSHFCGCPFTRRSAGGTGQLPFHHGHRLPQQLWCRVATSSAPTSPRRRVIVRCVAASDADVPLSGGELPTEITIFSVNDVYQLENYSRLREFVDDHTEGGKQPYLCTMNGDFLSPSLLSSFDMGAAAVAVMNEVGFTHYCFGNHEFDIPLTDVQLRVGELRGTLVNSNITFTRDCDKDDEECAPGLAWLPAADVVEIGGWRIGLFGVCTTNAVSNAHKKGLEFQPVLPRAHAIVDQLRNVDKVDAVVALTHLTIDEDRELARHVPGIDVILGGHEHTPFHEWEHGVQILKTGMDAENVFKVKLRRGLEKQALRLENYDGENDLGQTTISFYDNSVEVTAEMFSLLDYRTNPIVDQVIWERSKAIRDLQQYILPLHQHPSAKGRFPLSSEEARDKQCSLGIVVCSILRDELKAEVCFYNSGGLRGNLTYYGPMTYSDFVNEIPFPNNMLVVDMLGVELQEVARYSEARKGISWGGYLQWDDGVRMDSEGRLELLAGEEAELDRVYRVAVWGGLLDGYDDFTVLRGVGERHAHQCGSSLDALIEDGAPLKILALKHLYRRKTGQWDSGQLGSAEELFGSTLSSAESAANMLKMLNLGEDIRASEESMDSAGEEAQGKGDDTADLADVECVTAANTNGNGSSAGGNGVQSGNSVGDRSTSSSGRSG